MSILWMDDFKTYGTGSTGHGNMRDGTPWGLYGNQSGGSIIADPDPNAPSGSRALSAQGGGTNYYRLFANVLSTKMGFASRVWKNSLSTNKTIIAQYFGVGAAPYYSLIIEFNGALSWYRNSDGMLMATTDVPVITTNAWNHIESYVDSVAGDLEVRREGIPIPALTLSGDYAPASPIYGVQINRASSSSTGSCIIKDVVLWNGEGGVNDYFLGPCAVYRLPVSSDVSSGWSRSSGSSDYELLDEAPPNDADFIYAGEDPFPAPSIMGFDDLPEDVVAIRGVQTMVRARKTDGGDGSLQVSLSPDEGDNWADGADRAITTAFTYWNDISEVSPATATSWTPVEVNATEIKINRTV